METLRTDFIANVSHELKTPLAVIQNYGTMLQNPQLPEAERMEYAKSITDASRSLADMVSSEVGKGSTFTVKLRRERDGTV
jgi:signal transduction histidine kinase